ncbi:hypothetical protein F2Q70_00028853 [Brassica cretica]|uniref:RNase H type-1 domain-containing protein n=1 Tax=Brassica cretica TaxID=69181 RepID=A0A8S9LEQ1_BRACR|nr:hypothetical protein F2Q70_00028853 [Brassica cretica]
MKMYISFFGVTSALLGDLLALTWSTKAMKDLKFKNVMIEFSSTEAAGALTNPLNHPCTYQACHDILRAVHSLVGSRLLMVPVSSNVAAYEIACSVIRDHRHQSYVARSGPRWLSSFLLIEATRAN